MKLPDIDGFSVKQKIISPKGSDYRSVKTDYLKNSTNIEYGDVCKTRNARKLCYAFDRKPDQILPCNDRVFLRYGNEMYELKEGKDGLTRTMGFYLNTTNGTPNRVLVGYGDEVYIFPDAMRICPEAEWQKFADGVDDSARFPFINEYGLFYTNGIDGGVVCTDAEKLIPGTSIRFSWDKSIYTVIKRETVTRKVSEQTSQKNGESVEDNTEEIGTIVWLDRPSYGYQIMPIDCYAEISSPEIKPAAESFYVGPGWRGTYFSGNTINFTVTSGEKTYTDSALNYFSVGQKVQISGASENSNNIIATVISINDSAISFDVGFTNETLAWGQVVKITPILPQIDRAYSFDDRIFVADNTQKIFRASKAGKPMLFYGDEGKENGSWKCSLSEECTGITVYKNQLICLCRSSGFKLYGNSAENFSFVRLPISGIKVGSEETFCTLSDMAFYVSKQGVMKYSGTVDSKISWAVELFAPTVAVTQGFNYYLLDNDKIYVYSSVNDCWWCEDGKGIFYMFVFGGIMYYVRREGVYSAEGGNVPVKWNMETARISDDSGCRVQPLSLRVELQSNNGCEIYPFMRCTGDKNYIPLVGKSIFGEVTLNIPLKKKWCDGFYLKLCGKGDVNFKNIFVRYGRKKEC